MYFAIKRQPWSSKVIAIILAFFWLWMGAIYHITFVSTINKAANIFGLLFILQTFLLLYFLKDLSFHFPSDKYGFAGFIMLLFAMFVYPSIGYLLGHTYPYAPTFGLPCPTTIFTFGILLVSDNKIPVRVAVIPLLWASIGTLAAVYLGFYEDIGLFIAALIFIALLISKNKGLAHSHALKVKPSSVGQLSVLGFLGWMGL